MIPVGYGGWWTLVDLLHLFIYVTFDSRLIWTLHFGPAVAFTLVTLPFTDSHGPGYRLLYGCYVAVTVYATAFDYVAAHGVTRLRVVAHRLHTICGLYLAALTCWVGYDWNTMLLPGWLEFPVGYGWFQLGIHVPTPRLFRRLFPICYPTSYASAYGVLHTVHVDYVVLPAFTVTLPAAGHTALAFTLLAFDTHGCTLPITYYRWTPKLRLQRNNAAWFSVNRLAVRYQLPLIPQHTGRRNAAYALLRRRALRLYAAAVYIADITPAPLLTVYPGRLPRRALCPRWPLPPTVANCSEHWPVGRASLIANSVPYAAWRLLRCPLCRRAPLQRTPANVTYRHHRTQRNYLFCWVRTQLNRTLRTAATRGHCRDGTLRRAYPPAPSPRLKLP